MPATRQIRHHRSGDSATRLNTGAERQRRISARRLALLLLTAFCIALTSSCTPIDTSTPSTSVDTASPSASDGSGLLGSQPVPDMSDIKVPGILPDDELLIDIDVMDLVFYSQFTARKKFEFVFVSSKPVKAADLAVTLSGVSAESFVPTLRLIEIIEKDNGFPYHLFQTYQGMDWSEYNRLYERYLEYFDKWDYSLLPDKEAFEQLDKKDYPAYMQFLANDPPIYRQYFAYVDLSPLFEGDRTGSVEFNRLSVRYGDQTYDFDVRVKIDYDRTPPQSISKHGSHVVRETVIEPVRLTYSKDGSFIAGYTDLLVDESKIAPQIFEGYLGEYQELYNLRLHVKDVRLIDSEEVTLRGIRLNNVTFDCFPGRMSVWVYDHHSFFDGIIGNYWDLRDSEDRVAQIEFTQGSEIRTRFHFDIVDPRYRETSAYIGKYYARIYYSEIDPETYFLIEDLYDYCEINVITRRNVHEIVAERLDGLDVKARYFNHLYAGAR